MDGWVCVCVCERQGGGGGRRGRWVNGKKEGGDKQKNYRRHLPSRSRLVKTY